MKRLRNPVVRRTDHRLAFFKAKGFALWLATGGALCAGAAPLAQQSAPRFEVASIRPVPPGGPLFVVPRGWTPVEPNGRYVNPHTTAFYMIMFAYDVVHPDVRLIGLPDWGPRAIYAVNAAPGDDFPRLSPAENRHQVQLMVRELLKDRFHLQLHAEMRQEAILKMTVDPGGLRLTESPAPAPPEQEGTAGLAMGDKGGRLVCKKCTLSRVATSAGTLLRQEVIDDTHLKGYYDFDFSWTAPEITGAPAPSPRLGPDGVALFMTTLKDRVGLRFSAAKGPVQYWVVDHIETPSEN